MMMPFIKIVPIIFLIILIVITKDLTCHPLSRHLMTYGDGHEDVITQVVTF